MRIQARSIWCELALTVVLVAFFATPAWAQSEDLTRSYQRGSALFEAGNYKASTPYFARALALSEAEYGPNSSRTGFILKNLATVHAKQGQFAAAEPLYIRALGIFEEAFGRDHGVVAEITNELSIVYVERKRFIEAEPLLGRVLENLEKTFGPDDPRVAVAAYNFAYASEYLGDANKARIQYARALAIWQSQPIPDNDRIQVAQERIAGLTRVRGRRGPSLAPYLPRVLPDYSARARARVQEAPSPVSGPPEVAKAAPKPRVQTALGQPWRVQLAAFRSRESAEREAARLQTAHAALFEPVGGLKVFVAALAKGTFYRVGTGPVADRNTAAVLCKDLKAQDLPCIVVR